MIENIKTNNTDNNMSNIVTHMKEDNTSWRNNIGINNILFQEAINKGGGRRNDQRYI